MFFRLAVKYTNPNIKKHNRQVAMQNAYCVFLVEKRMNLFFSAYF